MRTPLELVQNMISTNKYTIEQKLQEIEKAKITITVLQSTVSALQDIEASLRHVNEEKPLS